LAAFTIRSNPKSKKRQVDLIGEGRGGQAGGERRAILYREAVMGGGDHSTEN